MDKCKRRSPSRINFGSSSSFDLYQRSSWWPIIKCKIVCRWYIFIFGNRDVDTFANDLNNDLYQINKWAFQWEMCFNPDTNKQAQQIIFCRKTKKILILHYVFIIALLRNPHINNSMETTSSLWWRNLWWSLQQNILSGTWIYSI